MFTNKKWVFEFALLFIALISIAGIREFNFMNENRQQENEFNVLNLVATPNIAVKNKVQTQHDSNRAVAEDSVSHIRKAHRPFGRETAWD